MADTIIAASLTLDAQQANTSVGNFKKELREANAELLTTTEKFGETSKEAVAAAQRVAKLRDAIGDAKTLVDAFNPDRKFQAFAGAVQGVTGGFAALQGVMGLVGSESENLQKSLLKVQSALAITQGVDNIRDSVQQFKNLGAVIQQSTIFQKANAAATALAAGAMRLLGLNAATSATGFKILKGAIAATGIGLAVVAVTALVGKISEWTGATNRQKDAQDRLNKSLEEYRDLLDDDLKAIDYWTQVEVVRAKAAGQGEEAVQKIRDAGAAKRLAFLRANIEKIEATETDAIIAGKKAQENYKEELKAAQEKYDDEVLKQNTDSLKKQEDAIDESNARRKEKAKADAAERIKLQKELAEEERKARESDIPTVAQSTSRAGDREQEAESDPVMDIFGRPREVMLDAVTNLYKDISDRGAQFTANEKILAEQRAEYTRQEAEQRKAAYVGIGNALGALGALIGKETTAGKVLAISQATINTWLGVTEVLKQKSVLPEPLATISRIANVATVIAAGFNAIKNIAKTPTPGGGGTSAPTPSAPLTPQAQVSTTQLDQNSLNQIGNATVRTFVVESDITNNQERITRLNRQARIA